MSIRDDKRGIFTTIGAYTSFMNNNDLPDPRDKFTSINDTKNDISAFLIDVIKSIAGTDSIQDVVGKLLTDFVDNAEPQIKTAIKNQFIQFNAGDGISTAVGFTSGLRVPVSTIDVSGKYQTSGVASVDDLLHNNVIETFDTKAYQAIVNAGTDVVYNNLKIRYDASTDEFIFKPTIGTGISVGDWMGSYIDDAVVINKKDFLTNVLNSVYGTVTANQNKTVEQVYEELQAVKLLEKLINGDDSLVLTQDDFDELLQEAKNLVDGIVYYDMGCGMVGASLPLSGFTALISQISGMTDSYAMGTAIAGTIDDSSIDEEVNAVNKETIRDGFFKRIIKAITLILSEACTISPQIRALQAIMDIILNGGSVRLGKAKDDIVKFKVFIKCMVREAMKMISEFIFNLAISLLIAWLTPIIKKFAKEKITQYINILKSLIT